MFWRFLLKRLGQMIIVLFFVVVIAFLLVRITPGSPARQLLGMMATEEDIIAKEAELGLDKPIYVQFWIYLSGVLKGNLGDSIQYHQPVSKIFFSRLPNTLSLAAVSLIVGLVIAIPVGVIAGAHQGTGLDFTAMLIALLGQAMATVWLGVLNIYIFSVKLGWFPPMGVGGLKYMVLPALTMGYPLAAQICRLGRSGMIDVLREDYITATRARGIPSVVVEWKYAFRNALIPIITVVGMQIAGFLGGSVVVESIFSWTGVGSLMTNSVGNRDYAVVQSMLLLMAAAHVMITLIVDIINAKIDPRITLQ